MKSLHIETNLIAVLLTGYHLSAFSQAIVDNKPQVIDMTDGEIDDRFSVVRSLMYSCDMNIRAIIETNSIY